MKSMTIVASVFTASVLACTLAASPLLAAQAKDEAKQAGSAAKEAGKEAGKAAKHAGKATAQAVKGSAKKVKKALTPEVQVTCADGTAHIAPSEAEAATACGAHGGVAPKK